MSTTPAETPVLSFVQSLEESTSNVRVKVKTGQIWAKVKETIEESIALKGSFSISNDATAGVFATLSEIAEEAKSTGVKLDGNEVQSIISPLRSAIERYTSESEASGCLNASKAALNAWETLLAHDNEDSETVKRRAIQAIMRDKTLSQKEKQLRMQNLMSGKKSMGSPSAATPTTEQEEKAKTHASDHSGSNAPSSNIQDRLAKARAKREAAYSDQMGSLSTTSKSGQDRLAEARARGTAPKSKSRTGSDEQDRLAKARARGTAPQSKSRAGSHEQDRLAKARARGQVTIASSASVDPLPVIGKSRTYTPALTPGTVSYSGSEVERRVVAKSSVGGTRSGGTAALERNIVSKTGGSKNKNRSGGGAALADFESKIVGKPDETLNIAVAIPHDEPKKKKPMVVHVAEEYVERVPLWKNRKVQVITLISLIGVVSVAAYFGTRVAEPFVEDIEGMVPTESPTTGRFKSLTDILKVSVPNKFDEKDSPASRALAWIADEDEKQLNIQDPSLYQRFTLALLYYTTLTSPDNRTDWCYCGYDRPQKALNLLTVEEKFKCFAPCNLDPVEGSQFLHPSNECNWKGITCNDEKKVTEISLYGTGLFGELPSEIASLEDLTFIYLADNHITGTIPGAIGNLKSLSELYLHYNYMYGTIPDEIYGLESVYWLSLAHQEGNKTDGDTIYGLTGTISPLIGNMRKLENLDLFDNSLTGTIPEDIGNLRTRLQRLWIYGNRFSGVPLSLWKLEAVTSLWISDNIFTGYSLPSTIDMPNLKKLVMVNSQFGGSIPESFYNLTSLEVMNLGQNNFNGTLSSRIGQLQNLNFILLIDNRFTGTIPESIGNLTDLGLAWLYWNKFNGTVPEGLDHTKTNVQVDCKQEGSIECKSCAACCNWKFECECTGDSDCSANYSPPPDNV